jgi:biopolymer transport protein ExbB/TolQ
MIWVVIAASVAVVALVFGGITISALRFVERQELESEGEDTRPFAAQERDQQLALAQDYMKQVGNLERNAYQRELKGARTVAARYRREARELRKRIRKLESGEWPK